MKRSPVDDPTTIDLLKETKQKVESVVEYINESKRLAENLQKILDIQKYFEGKVELVTATRRFIREGTIICKEKNDLPNLSVFLFNDLLVLAKPKPKIYSMELKHLIPLEEAKIINISDTEELMHAFELATPKKNVTLACATVEDKNEWLKDIKNIKKEIQKRQYEEQYGKKRGSFSMTVPKIDDTPSSPKEAPREPKEITIPDEDRRHEDQERMRRQEEQQQRTHAAEQERVQKQQEEQRKTWEEEQRRQQAEQDNSRREEEERRNREADNKFAKESEETGRRVEEELRRQAEIEKRKEEQTKKQREEEERKRKADEEMRKKPLNELYDETQQNLFDQFDELDALISSIPGATSSTTASNNGLDDLDELAKQLSQWM